MTYEDALNIIKTERECVKRQNGSFCDNQRDCINCDLAIPDQSVIEAYDITIEALEKQLPKKEVKKTAITYDGELQEYGVCPICGEQARIAGTMTAKYCWKCGQRLEY